tara:strand:+ start:352 stop:762 length:411 start_codon:yes stop_codon:yes gene_type:complete
MRHRKSGRKFNRNSSHRAAMIRNLASSIIMYESVKTTLAKAKEIRRFLEPLITLSKENSVANQRLVFSRLRNREATAKLFDELGPRFKERPGGYLRILKRGYRAGDKSPIAQIELVEKSIENEQLPESEEVEKEAS